MSSGPLRHPRSNSAPLRIDKRIYLPKSLAYVQEVSLQSLEGPPQSSIFVSARTWNSNTKTRAYREQILEGNRIHTDSLGGKMPEDIKPFLNTHILKARLSPPLELESLEKTRSMAAQLGSDSKRKVIDLVRETVMFPIEHPDIQKGGDGAWYTLSLPNELLYPGRVLAPEPIVADIVGPTGREKKLLPSIIR